MHLVAAFCMLWQDAVLPVIRDVKAVAQMANGVDYLTSGILEFEGGARASLSAGMILGGDTGHRFDRLYVHGSRGCIHSAI